jgi:hypothetical protein
MDADTAVKKLSELLAYNADRHSTMHQVLDRPTVQAIAFAVAYIHQSGEQPTATPTPRKHKR